MSMHLADSAAFRRSDLESASVSPASARELALEFNEVWAARRQPASGQADVVDLFCGCGGLSCGFELVGRAAGEYRLAAAVDINGPAAETYAANLPIRPLLADLLAATDSPAAIDELVGLMNLREGAPLILIGGPPCQGFSAHRKKQGDVRDGRNALVAAFSRVAVRLQPDFIVLENVPELLAKRHWGRYLSFRRDLEECGYTVRAQIHNLAAFGVPQARFRALVLASKSPFHMPEGFLTPASFRTVRAAIGHLPPVEPGVPSPHDPMHVCTRHRRSTIETIRSVPLDGGSRPAGVGPECLDKVDGFRDVYGRLYWDRPANTITAFSRNPASGRYVHPEQHRGLSVREAALLQGFPSDFVFCGPFDDRFSQIGNAVPPVFATFIAAHVAHERAVDRAGSVCPNSDSDVTQPTSNSFSSGIAGRKKGMLRP